MFSFLILCKLAFVFSGVYIACGMPVTQPKSKAGGNPVAQAEETLG